MTILRSMLLLVLSVIGGYIGLALGRVYLKLDYILKYIGDNPGITTGSLVGFTLIGIILGLYSYTKITAYITNLADNLREMPANDKIALCFGAVVGLVPSFLMHPIFSQMTTEPAVRTLLQLGFAMVMVFLSTQGAMSMREELRKILQPGPPPKEEEKPGLKQGKILDTNIIIDGRIADICRTGFIDGTIYVPGFVLDELQLIADSSDALKRARGRRGLDILNSMQKEFPLVVRTFDYMLGREEGDPVDSKLVRLAKASEGTIVTNDFNLNRVAELQGVKVMNVNELANALKPVVLPGEELRVHVIKEGKEPGQGIAYLDDGTMVVVENARRQVGETVDVVVASVLQTVAGKMIFGNLRDVAEEEEDLMDRNLRSYYRGQGRRHGGPRT